MLWMQREEAGGVGAAFAAADQEAFAALVEALRKRDPSNPRLRRWMDSPPARDASEASRERR
jgi:hypothetical protein